MELKEVLNKFTKEEMLSELKNASWGWEDNIMKVECPSDLGLRTHREICTSQDDDKCEKCWRKSLEKIRFKDEIETLSLQEVLEKENGIRYYIFFDDNKVGSLCVYKDCFGLVWEKSGKPVQVESRILTARYEVAEKKVSFKNALRELRDSESSVICSRFYGKEKIYYGKDNNNPNNVIIDSYENGLSINEILDATWHVRR